MRTHKRMLALGVTLALALAACGNGDDGDAGDEGNGDGDGGGGEQSLDVWIMEPGSDEVGEILEQTVADFEDENEGVSVDLQLVPWANAHDQFVTAIGGGQVPDVAEMGTTWTPEFADLGALAEIEGGGGDYIESLVESGTVEGTSYGYPWYAGARSLIYRSDVFEDLGLEEPETWEDVLAAGETIEAETDLDPIHVAGDYNHMIMPMVWQFGGELAVEEDDGSYTAQVDSEEGRQAIETYVEVFERGWAPQGAVNWTSVDIREAFTNGDSAMMLGGGWDLAAALGDNPDLEGNVATTLSPSGEGGTRDAFAGGSHLVAFEESENPDLAVEFIEFVLEEERVTEFAEAVGFLPGTVSGVEASEASGDEVNGTFATQLLDHSRSYPSSPAWGAIEGDQVFTNAIQGVMQGDLTVDEAATQIDEQMNEAFEG